MTNRHRSPPRDPFPHFVETVLPAPSAPALAPPLRAIAQTVALEGGQTFRIERGADRFVFIASGAAKLVALASARREQVVAFHFAGDLLWIASPPAHDYLLAALAGTTLVTFPATAFISIVESDAAVMKALFERMQQALLRSREKSVSLGRKTAQERIAGFLATMADRIGTGDALGPQVDLPMSRRDIADSLGLTIETVSRQFSELRAAQLIETHGRSHVRVCNLAGLADRAGHARAPL
ncbi:helix-turn-helix domain-containing protein [Tsuneonella sp. YG55]|uniref:Helix-turn-helix domain-containing protein n=1 Tax=Tsuneonella litorea TaxID=2976475 RepID=A0A9X3A8W1_9SPHN|nr:helix-turn-helix domain-containing protein [Tsuneonella litorea]MCT2559891.1 helix-turn-helix domain-containing protein [Tsuneonella litorea]